MLIHELTTDECSDLLSRTHVGRLGCSQFNQPYIVPIHFSFDRTENYIYAFSTIGQKIKWMRKNPRVCLEVEEITDKDHWTTVIAVGRYKEIGQGPSDDDARRRAEQLFHQRREWWLPGAAKTKTGEREHIVLYRIQVDQVTGRRAARSRESVL
jgi:nitroimidazol reductase NimA-like FMN-containing flavoprotein (pyridoxamine 5'-phosphate oxidase superfamily)